MGRGQLLREKVLESVASVLPITAIVLVISITIAPLNAGTLVLFLFGAVLVVFGMGLFTMGADMAMTPMGEGIGVQMSHSKRIVVPLLVCLVLGVLITLAEPDLTVLANQMPAVPDRVLTITVAVGVGLFLAFAELRMLLKIPLSACLSIFYLLVFILAYFAPDTFIPAAFDAGGVTTGPITVPFIMAMGVGLASLRSDKNSTTDSFGLVAMCSVGPILSVLVLGIFYQPDSVSYTSASIAEVTTTRQAAGAFFQALPEYGREVAVALLPILAVFLLFQLIFRRFHRRQLIRVAAGFVYTYVGLVLFLTGVNVGFMPVGQLLGENLGASDSRWLLVPIGMLIGYFIVKAEPAVGVLTRQVEEITNGSVTRRSIQTSLSIGIACAVGLSMVRILTGISILWFLIPGYIISVALTFFVPQIFTGIAFDSGGVASGPMTTTFLLPLAIGACQAVGGNVMTDAFGIVALVAMMPLVTIQVLGLVDKLRARKALRQQIPAGEVEDTIIFFGEA
ncbi:MAG: DUF1538 domain-containing protein [Oscillospiraceae bacterium]|nr:DUF1538 domain-containing protein [Oscillospiraceae bacterium]